MKYNYKVFKNSEYTIIHSSGLKIGQKIPDLDVYDLEGNKKSFLSLVSTPIILETGSITCGMFAHQNKRMNALAKKQEDFTFLILYVREVHPGKLIKPHDSISQKCLLAERLLTEEKIQNRFVVVDNLNGDLHQLLGALPNMVFLINEAGEICYKNDWNNSKQLEKAINSYTKSEKVIKQKWTMLPIPNLKADYRVFKRAGWDAGLDFIKALPKLIYSHLIQGINNYFK
ncbi:MAG: deiodinase-like protein [Cellulophaga sp.]